MLTNSWFFFAPVLSTSCLLHIFLSLSLQLQALIKYIVYPSHSPLHSAVDHRNRGYVYAAQCGPLLHSSTIIFRTGPGVSSTWQRSTSQTFPLLWVRVQILLPCSSFHSDYCSSDSIMVQMFTRLLLTRVKLGCMKSIVYTNLKIKVMVGFNGIDRFGFGV